MQPFIAVAGSLDIPIPIEGVWTNVILHYKGCVLDGVPRVEEIATLQHGIVYVDNRDTGEFRRAAWMDDWVVNEVKDDIRKSLVIDTSSGEARLEMDGDGDLTMENPATDMALVDPNACPKCGGVSFTGHQVQHWECRLNQHGDWEENIECYEADDPFGPFYCNKCDAEYKSLAPPVSSNPARRWRKR